MAQFQPCFNFTIGWEGKVLENVSGDPGGLTFWGIARNENPNWPGWVLVDDHIKTTDSMDDAESACNNDPAIVTLAEQFYQQSWNSNNLGKINYQELALQVFDKYWNMGEIALKVFQILIGVTGDGIIGPNTISTVNKVQNPSDLVDGFLDWAKAHYTDIVANHPDEIKFYKGWENRCIRSDGQN